MKIRFAGEPRKSAPCGSCGGTGKIDDASSAADARAWAGLVSAALPQEAADAVLSDLDKDPVKVRCRVCGGSGTVSVPAEETIVAAFVAWENFRVPASAMGPIVARDGAHERICRTVANNFACMSKVFA